MCILCDRGFPQSHYGSRRGFLKTPEGGVLPAVELPRECSEAAHERGHEHHDDD